MSEPQIFDKAPYHVNWSLVRPISLTLIFLAALFYLYGEQIHSLFTGPVVVEEEADSESDFPYEATGTITFSAARPEFLPNEYVMGNYQVSAENPEIGYTELLPFSGMYQMFFTDSSLQEGFVIYDYEQSSDDEPLAADEQVGVGRFTVVDFDQSELDISPISLSGWFERHVRYSQERQKLTFITTHQQWTDLESFQSMENWTINIFDVHSDERNEVATGTSPVWYKDTGNLFYIRPEGIAFYDAEREESTLVSQVGETALTSRGLGSYTFNNRLEITPDGSTLLLTSPVDNAIHFFAITNQVVNDEEQISLERIASHQNDLGIGYYEPVISPDGQYFAVLKTTFAAPHYEAIEEMQIAIGSIEHQTIVRLVDVSDFAFQSFFIDSWQ